MQSFKKIYRGKHEKNGHAGQFTRDIAFQKSRHAKTMHALLYFHAWMKLGQLTDENSKIVGSHLKLHEKPFCVIVYPHQREIMLRPH